MLRHGHESFLRNNYISCYFNTYKVWRREFQIMLFSYATLNTLGIISSVEFYNR